MIALGIGAKMSCDAEGCDKWQPVQIVLLVSGGLGPRPSIPGWQIGASPGGAFACRCPEHQQVIQSVKPGARVTQ